MSTPRLSDPKKRRTKQTLQAPRQVREDTAKKQSFVFEKSIKKLVWVTVGKTEHQAWLLEDLGDKEDALIQWESTRGKELVSVLNIRLEMPSRRSRQQGAQITDMKKLLSPPTPKELLKELRQDAENAKKKKQTEMKSAPTARMANNESSKASGKSKKKKRRQKAGAPKSYADISEIEVKLDKSNAFKSARTSESDVQFEFNEEAATGESSDEDEFDLEADDLGVLPRTSTRSNIPSPEGPVTRKRPRLSFREQLSDDYDSDLLDSEGDLLPDDNERPVNSDDDEDPAIIKKSKYIKRISLTPRPGGGYHAEIMDSYHFPKLGSKTLPKPQRWLAALPVHVSLIDGHAESSGNEAETNRTNRTIARVSKSKISDAAETNIKNSNADSSDDEAEINRTIQRVSKSDTAKTSKKDSNIDSSDDEAEINRTIERVSKSKLSDAASNKNSKADSSDDEAEMNRTIERVSKRKLSDAAATSHKNWKVSGKEMGTKADKKVEMKVDPPANKVSVGSEAMKIAGAPASAKSAEKIIQESIVEASIPSLSSVPSLVSDMQSGTFNEKTKISGNLPNAKEGAKANSAVVARANEKVVSKRLIGAPTTNHIVGSREEARTAESRPAKIGISKKPAEGLSKKVVPEPSVHEKLFVSGLAQKPTTSASVWQKPTEFADTESDSTDDEDARIKRVHAWMEVAKKKNTFLRVQCDKSKAAAREQGVRQPPEPHKTATNGTENQDRKIQDTAGKRVSASNVETTSGDNIDLPKKIVILRPTTGLWRANDRNSSNIEVEIERNKSQSSFVQKDSLSSSAAKNVVTKDDIDSSDDEAEERRAKKQALVRSLGPHQTATYGAEKEGIKAQDAAGKRVSASNVETASDDNTDLPKKSVILRPTTGLWRAKDRNSSNIEVEIERNKSQPSVVEKVSISSSAAKATATTDDIDSSDDEAEERRARKQDLMRPPGPHQAASNGTEKQGIKAQDAAGKRVSASNVETASDDNTAMPKKSITLHPTTGLRHASDRNSSNIEVEIERNKSQSSVVQKDSLSSSAAKATATTDDIDSSDDEAEERRAKKQALVRSLGPHQTATNGTENQDIKIQDAAGKRVSTSTAETASDDNTDVPKKSGILRPTTGLWPTDDRNSSSVEMEIEGNKSQPSVIEKASVSSSAAKAVATTDDIDSSGDTAELRRARKQDLMRPPGPHQTATTDTENQGIEMQDAAGKRVSASNAVVEKVSVSSPAAKAVATTDDIDSSDDEAELRRARSAFPSTSSNTLSSIQKWALPYEKGGSVGSPESRSSSAKPTGMPDPYDGNSSDDEGEIRRTKERIVAPPAKFRANLPVGVSDCSDDKAELQRTKRRDYDLIRKKSTGRKRRRKMPLAAKRRAASFTIDTESPFRKSSASRIAEGNCIGFSRAGAQSLKRLLVKDFADRVATRAMESSRETIKAAGSARIQESPDLF
jgi:hypothetical protein